MSTSAVLGSRRRKAEYLFALAPLKSIVVVVMEGSSEEWKEIRLKGQIDLRGTDATEPNPTEPIIEPTM